MALQWKWTDKMGKAIIRQNERKYEIGIYGGNALAIFISEEQRLIPALQFHYGRKTPRHHQREQVQDVLRRGGEHRAERMQQERAEDTPSPRKGGGRSALLLQGVRVTWLIRWGKKPQSERHRQRNNINPKKN